MEIQAIEETRLENDERLADALDDIAAAKDIDSLAQFAKAYLGLYLNIESSVPPDGRVRMLASQPLADAVFSGFQASLLLENQPQPSNIGESVVADRPINLGYVLLAGLDRLADASMQDLLGLPQATLKSGLCFHFASLASHQHEWARVLIHTRPEIASTALSDFWQGMVGSGTDYLPGLNQIFGNQKIEPLIAEIVLPLIRSWNQCKDQVLRDLLYSALRSADLQQLLQIAEEKLIASPMVGGVRRVYWLATASMIAPKNYIDALVHYIDRSREKALRLLDFLSHALSILAERDIRVQPEILGKFLLVIASKFPPQGDLTGPLDDTSQKVLALFQYLGRDSSQEARQALEDLRAVRVMRVCDDVIDYTEKLQRQ